MHVHSDVNVYIKRGCSLNKNSLPHGSRKFRMSENYIRLIAI